MRIAIVIHSLAGGGAERAAVHLAYGLSRRGVQAQLICVRQGGELEGYAHQLLPDIQYLVAPTPEHRNRRHARLRSVIAVMREFRGHAYDVIITNSFPSTELVLLLKRLGIIRSRTITVYQSSVIRHASDIFKASALQRAYLLLFSFLIRASDAITAPSLGASRELESALRLASGSVSTVYNVVNEDTLRTRLDDRVAGCTPFDTLQRPIVMSVGRLEHPKNFQDLIRAFDRATRDSGGSLVILGEGSRRDELRSLSVELGIANRVLLPGFVQDVYGAMATADVMAWSSNYEGFQVAMLEAAVIGKPVVSYRSPHGPQELAEFFPNQVRLVPLGAVDELADALVMSFSAPQSNAEPTVFVPSAFRLETYTAAFCKLISERKNQSNPA